MKNISMRDALLEKIFEFMQVNDKIFFLSADLGAPALDKIRNIYRDRFINVGIAEQNLINVATGLALEGFIVYAYAIAPFLLRPFEQIRVNLALSSQVRKLNVNIIGVGSGVSYDVAGPTHHCFEDLSVMRTLPNLVVCSPSDSTLAGLFAEYSVNTVKPKYIRLDSKPLPRIYDDNFDLSYQKGFYELAKGKNTCIVATGYMTHIAREICNELAEHQLGLIDVFTVKPLDVDSLGEILRGYKKVITMEEAFIGKGGLDTLMLSIVNDLRADIFVKRIGFADNYIFKSGSRDFLYGQSGIDKTSIIKWINNEA